MPKWILPWLFPVGLLVAVLLVVAGSVVAAVVWLLACYVGVPLIWRAYDRIRAQRRGVDGVGPLT